MPSPLRSAVNAAASALNAERARIEVAVSNLANIESTRGADGQPYRRRDVVLKEGEPPLLGVFAMVKSLDLPERFRASTWVEPPLTIRTKDGQVHPEYSAVKLSFGFPP